MTMKDKTAVVTGAGRGIGRETALAFARAGADVALCARHAETINPVAEEIRALGRRALPAVLNVADEKAVEKFADDCFAEFGRVDVLVCNAGVTRDNFFLRMKPEQWDEVIDVNLRGAFLCCRFFSRRMMKQKSGRIINMSSVAGQAGSPGQSNYSAAKAGIIGMTKSIAKELAHYGITVNAIAPGLIDTDMLKGIEPQVMEKIVGSIPMGRLGAASDVAAAALFLASDAAAYVTGQVLRVDGGLYM